MDFQVGQVKPGRTPFTLIYGPDVPPSESAPVDPDTCSWPPEKIVASLYMVDQHGVRYRAAFDPERPKDLSHATI